MTALFRILNAECIEFGEASKSAFRTLDNGSIFLTDDCAFNSLTSPERSVRSRNIQPDAAIMGESTNYSPSCQSARRCADGNGVIAKKGVFVFCPMTPPSSRDQSVVIQLSPLSQCIQYSTRRRHGVRCTHDSTSPPSLLIEQGSLTGSDSTFLR